MTVSGAFSKTTTSRSASRHDQATEAWAPSFDGYATNPWDNIYCISKGSAGQKLTSSMLVA
ncbi:MAG: hypothetical protein OSB69_05875, partial [Alphaproteobacteria bacterium]|nr:hypothetical protein [Alphaproteobacteria bacterium]